MVKDKSLNVFLAGLKKLPKAFADILFPPLCHVCKTFIPDAGSIHLCSSCTNNIRFVGSPLCSICGVPFVAEQGIDHACGACVKNLRPFASARAAVEFHGPIQELIRRFKYGKKVHLCRTLGQLAAQRLNAFAVAKNIDILVPVPLHPRRLRERGFNQALLLAEVLSNSWHIPICRSNLQRTRWTEPQIRLSIEERLQNVRGAFAVKNPQLFHEAKLLLVDDVYTTGSTAAECAKVLKRAGAAEIYVATVARAATR